MSSTNPPTGPGGPEYLEHGGGSPLEPSPKGSGAGRRSALVAVGVVAGLALVGAGAYGAWSWFSQGAQPADALPDTTLGYASIDLDPSGEQKIEAIKILKKFPAFNDEIDLDTDDDIRQKLFEEMDLDEACKGLDYEDDIESWLGDRAALAAVDNGGKEPDVAFVVQVKDEEAASDGLTKIRDCGAGESGGDESGGWSINGDWVVVAETQKIAQEIADDASESPLSDDEDYQKWTDEVGDPGVINMYAAPEAGKFLAEAMESAMAFPMAEDFATSCAVAYDSEFMESGTELESDLDPNGGPGCEEEEFEGFGEDMGSSPEVPDEVKKAFEDFGGAALTVRFDDGALEVEMASDAAIAEQGFSATDTGGDMVQTLPEDTAVALGVGLPEGWLQAYLDNFSSMWGDQFGMDIDQLIEQAEAETGLQFPEDIETLFGESTAFAIGPDIDPEAFVNSDTPEGLPIGAKVKGDPDKIEAVLETIRAQMGEASDLLVSESNGDEIAIGADEAYVSDILGDGNLGDSETFQNVVREADDATSVVYVNFDAGDGWLVKLAGDDQEAADNLEPLQGIGASGWVEDDENAHFVLRVTTN